MRKWEIFFLLLFLLVLPTFLFAQSVEKIKEFSVDININEDGSFLVKEKIIYDFGQNLWHGIYRDIPLKGITIKVLKVVDELGHPYLFKTSKQNSYLRIKIGDPQKYVSGEKTYLILYQVKNGLGFFKDHDELYWNVTGNEWMVPIEKANITIHLPEKISESNLNFDCFTGFFGSKERSCTFKVKEDGSIYFESERELFPKEGLTVVLGFPKQLVKEPGFIEKFFWKLKIFWPFLLPLFLFFYLFREWWRKGKDPKIEKSIIPQYEPPDNLRPAQVSLIIKQKVEPIDISATLVDLAVRGFLKIREIKRHGIFEKNDYELIKLKDFNDPKEGLYQYEKELLNKIFSSANKEEPSIVYLSSLKNKFYPEIKKLINEINKETFSLGYFVSIPKKAKEKWLLFGAIILWFSCFLIKSPITKLDEFQHLGNAGIISAILFFIFSLLMPKRTKKGTEAYWHALGFKEYINTAEKYRAQFYEKENIFEKYLPYAIVFGLINKWAKAFEGIYNKPPSWYEGDFGSRFTTYSFLTTFNRSFSNFNNVFLSRPGGKLSGLRGAGFSGGGGGGGGGGSW